MATTATKIGKRIREARKSAGLNPERFAVKLNISVATVQRWETGRTEPTLSKLTAVAKATGKPLSFFLETEVRVVA